MCAIPDGEKRTNALHPLFHKRLLIAFLVHLICHMVLPHYCAVRLKEMYLNFIVYIYIYILLVFHECILQQYKEQHIFFIPDLVLHLFSFLCSQIIVFFIII